MSVHWPGKPVSWSPVIGCGGDGLPCQDRCWARGYCRRGMHPDHRKVAKWDGTMLLRGDKVLYAPLARRKPTLYSVCLLGDLFHRNVPVRYVAQVFDIMASATLECKRRHGADDEYDHTEECWTGDRHTFILCTKRTDRMRKVLTEELPEELDEHWPGDCCVNLSRDVEDWPLPNVWLGTSVSGDWDALRVNDLLETPAAHRWLSYEPALEPLKLRPEWLAELDCVIAGAESGPGRRPCPDQWLDDVAEQCRTAGVPCVIKQRNVNGRVVPQPLPTEWPWMLKEE